MALESLTQSDKDELLRLYQKEGWSTANLSRKFGYEKQAILRFLKRNGQTIRHGIFPGTVMNSRTQEILRLHYSGLKNHEIADQMGVTKQWVSFLVTRLKVKRIDP